MLQKTQSILLRTIKYGETSLICTLFTADKGVQSFLIQGVRGGKSRSNKVAYLQPATLLDIVAYRKPQQQLHRLREYQPAIIYKHVQEDVRRNSVALFSVELLWKLLPENAPMPELFNMAWNYFIQLDEFPIDALANFPLFFIIQCSELLGYSLLGNYAATTTHLNLQEGGFTAQPPAIGPFVNDEDAKALSQLLACKTFSNIKTINMNGAMRSRLTEWYIAYLQQHTQHMGQLKSLIVLKAILH
jgi:DNA repair protein RecO (recombination protein O)